MGAILIVGAAGEVGRAVIASLVARGARLRALVHSTPVDGVESVRGDLTDPASLAAALADCDGACFITPHHADEQQLGMSFIAACQAAQLRRLVYVSAYHPVSGSLAMQRVLDGILGMIGPHYRAKLAVERAVRKSRLSPVVLGPSNFYQNDELALPEIQAGRYPNPMGDKPVSRVDTRDIGDAAARALLDDDVAPGAYPLVGPDVWTGAQVAAVWSEALGQPVAYPGNDIETWRATVGARMRPEARANDFGKTYRILQRFGAPANAKKIAQTTALLGRPPRDFRSYVSEQVERLRGARAI
jgi:uncharacterized protein YbjT (DUF2867 family)